MNVRPILVELTAQEFIEFEELQARNVAKAVKDASFTHEGKYHRVMRCPVCDTYLAGDSKFCKGCGQRLDLENIEF